MDNSPDSPLSPEERKRLEQTFQTVAERMVSKMNATAERIGGKIDRISASLDALPGLNARVNALSERVGRDVARVIDRPYHFHSASEYRDVFGSGRRRLGHYG